MEGKTNQYLAFILKLYKHCTILNLIKLAYLVDHFSCEKIQRPLTGLNYKLYSFGLFSHDLFKQTEILFSNKIITCNTNYTRNGLEYVVYAFNDMISDLKFKNEVMPDVSLGEFYLMRDILYSLFYYTEKDLTKMIYTSKPVSGLAVKPGQPLGQGREIKFE